MYVKYIHIQVAKCMGIVYVYRMLNKTRQYSREEFLRNFEGSYVDLERERLLHNANASYAIRVQQEESIFKTLFGFDLFKQ